MNIGHQTLADLNLSENPDIILNIPVITEHIKKGCPKKAASAAQISINLIKSIQNKRFPAS
jgi:hypothetical protein